MKRNVFAILAVMALIATPAMGADLNVSIEQTSCRTEEFPLDLEFDIIGELSESALNEGLAAVGFDLSLGLNGAPVDINTYTIAVTPGAGMAAFVKDIGLTNPAGYGGTAVGLKLVQIGGAQDTINNAGSVATFPTGPVVEQVGWAPVVLATVAITLNVDPDPDQNYTFTVDQVFGNVIQDDEVAPVYKVEALGNDAGAVAATTVVYHACRADIDGDRNVGTLDTGAIQGLFGCDVNDPDPGANCLCNFADIDGDGTVGTLDTGAAQASFGVCH